MVTLCWAESNTPEKKSDFFSGEFFASRCLRSLFYAKAFVFAPCGWSMRGSERRRELVGLQFLFGAAAEVVPVEGTPKVVAVL